MSIKEVMLEKYPNLMDFLQTRMGMQIDSICSIMKEELSILREAKIDDLAVSIDLETVTSQGPGILTIGVVPFTTYRGQIFESLGLLIECDFIDAFTLAASKNPIAMAHTMRFWMMQEDAARHEAIGFDGMMRSPNTGKETPKYRKGLSQKEACIVVFEYIQMLKDNCQLNVTIRPMGNSNTFDVGKLEETAIASGAIVTTDTLPYMFFHPIDLRSILYTANMVTGKAIKKLVKREGTHHAALDDAIYQAQLAVKAFEELKAFGGHANGAVQP